MKAKTMAHWMKLSSGTPVTRDLAFWALHDPDCQKASWEFSNGTSHGCDTAVLISAPRNLSRLHEQLQSKKLQEILTVLEHAKSGWLKKFRALEEDIKNGSIEAKDIGSNLSQVYC